MFSNIAVPLGVPRRINDLIRGGPGFGEGVFAVIYTTFWTIPKAEILPA